MADGPKLELVGIGLIVAGAAGGGLRLAGVVELDSFGTVVAAGLVVLGAVVLKYRTDWQVPGIAVMGGVALLVVVTSAVFGSGDVSPTTTTLAVVGSSSTSASPSTTTTVPTATTQPTTTVAPATAAPLPTVPSTNVAADAIADLRGNGACLVVSYFPTFGTRDGDVIETSPEPGTSYEPGDTVRVNVASNPPSPTVLTIRERGVLRVSFTGVIGQQQPDGTFTGFEPEVARELASRILGDPVRIEYQALSAAERFTAIANGEVDVLFGVRLSGETTRATRFYDDDSTRQVAITASDEVWLEEFDRNLGEILVDAGCRP